MPPIVAPPPPNPPPPTYVFVPSSAVLPDVPVRRAVCTIKSITILEVDGPLVWSVMDTLKAAGCLRVAMTVGDLELGIRMANMLTNS